MSRLSDMDLFLSPDRWHAESDPLEWRRYAIDSQLLDEPSANDEPFELQGEEERW